MTYRDGRREKEEGNMLVAEHPNPVTCGEWFSRARNKDSFILMHKSKDDCQQLLRSINSLVYGPKLITGIFCAIHHQVSPRKCASSTSHLSTRIP